MSVSVAPAAVDVLPHAARARSVSLDRLRGLAVLLMVADHLLIVTGHEYSSWRYTVTRAAMPLFFVIAGHLFTRLHKRHLYVFAAGYFLPMVVLWVDVPNVLCWYVLGCCWLSLSRWLPRLLVLGLPIAAALTVAANSYAIWPLPSSYDPLALLALLCLGALLPRPAFDFAGRLPRPLAGLGRFPLSVYLGHVLALQVAVWVVRS